MVNRYFTLLEFVQNERDLEEHLPAPAVNRRLRKLLDEMEMIESVSKELQSATTTMLDARIFFDGLIDFRRAFGAYLGKRNVLSSVLV